MKFIVSCPFKETKCDVDTYIEIKGAFEVDIFALNWIPLVITGLGTLFLIGEILVNTKGIFGLLGIGFIVIYLSVNLDPSSFVIMLIIYFVGLLLIIVDGKLINDGTLATLGTASMLVSVAIAAPNLTAGLYAVLGVLIGGGASFLFLKVFKKRNMWSRLTLKDRLTKEAGYSTMNELYESLVGKEGITVSVMRPVGMIKIDNQQYSAVSSSQWLEKDTPIKVIEVDGTKILVAKISEI